VWYNRMVCCFHQINVWHPSIHPTIASDSHLKFSCIFQLWFSLALYGTAFVSVQFYSIELTRRRCRPFCRHFAFSIGSIAIRFDSTRLYWSWPIDIPIAICFQLTWQVMAAHWKFPAIRWSCTAGKILKVYILGYWIDI